MALIFLGCEKKNSLVIDPFGLSPVLSFGTVIPASVNSDTINVGTERKPEDLLPLKIKTYATVSHPQGKAGISSVSAKIFKETSSSPISFVELLDDGLGVDSSKNDGVYSGILSFSIQRSDIGTYWVELSSEDPHGFQSNTMLLPLQVFRGNSPPVLSNLQSPDSVKLSTQDQTLLLTVKASDPDGLSDIRQVIFNSFRPDGQPASGNPFRMFDDGTNGDAIAADGIYSLRITLPSNTTPGRYRFEFQAFDRSNASSNILVHAITVIP